MSYPLEPEGSVPPAGGVPQQPPPYAQPGQPQAPGYAEQPYQGQPYGGQPAPTQQYPQYPQAPQVPQYGQPVPQPGLQQPGPQQPGPQQPAPPQPGLQQPGPQQPYGQQPGPQQPYGQYPQQQRGPGGPQPLPDVPPGVLGAGLAGALALLMTLPGLVYATSDQGYGSDGKTVLAVLLLLVTLAAGGATVVLGLKAKALKAAGAATPLLHGLSFGLGVYATVYGLVLLISTLAQ